MNKILFLDMDGVLTDFVGRVCEVHQREDPYDNPTGHGIFEIETLWGISLSQFWEPINNCREFWYELNKTQEADELVETCIKLFGLENIAVLTAPSLDPHCISGKRYWIKKHYPQLSKQIIFANDKKFLAGPDRYLVDDRDKNLEDFEKYGGTAILFPRLWNRGHEYSKRGLEIVKANLNYCVPIGG